MLTQRFVIFFFGNFWLAYGNNSPQANLSSAEGLLWASDVQEATQKAQDEGDFVRRRQAILDSLLRVSRSLLDSFIYYDLYYHKPLCGF